MAQVTESELREKLRTDPSGLYLIYGEEDYLKKVWLERIISKNVESGFEEFNLHRFEAKYTTPGQIYDAVEAMPMMSASTCVVVEDFEPSSLEDDELALIEEMIADVPGTCALVFYQATNTCTGEKWKKLKADFEKYGTVAEFAKKDRNDIAKLVEKGASQRGTPFASGVAYYLIDCVGMDLNTVLNETEKLCAYAQDRTVTKADVDAVCPKTVEAKAFDIIKIMHSGRFDRAMTELDNVLAQKESPIMILGAFAAAYIDMYRARAAVVSGLKAQDAAKLFPSVKAFRFEQGARNSKGMSTEALYECLEVLAQADTMMKSTSVPQELILEQTLAKLALIEGKNG